MKFLWHLDTPLLLDIAKATSDIFLICQLASWHSLVKDRASQIFDSLTPYILSPFFPGLSNAYSVERFPCILILLSSCLPTSHPLLPTFAPPPAGTWPRPYNLDSPQASRSLCFLLLPLAEVLCLTTHPEPSESPAQGLTQSWSFLSSLTHFTNICCSVLACAGCWPPIEGKDEVSVLRELTLSEGERKEQIKSRQGNITSQWWSQNLHVEGARGGHRVVKLFRKCTYFLNQIFPGKG